VHLSAMLQMCDFFFKRELETSRWYLRTPDRIEPHITAESVTSSKLYLCVVLTFKYPTSKSTVSPMLGPVIWMWPREKAGNLLVWFPFLPWLTQNPTVGCPVGHGDILAVVGQHGVVAEVGEIHGDNHQRPVRGVLEVTVPGCFEVGAEAGDLLFGWSELAGWEMLDGGKPFVKKQNVTYKHP
jgi:hypothetical protein